MCGIVGVIGDIKPSMEQSFDSAVDILSHRGPDGRGVWKSANVLLGHRRLSILDLSTTGSQPLIDLQTQTALTFNGEIYNYIEIRKDLKERGHTFESTCDTEVLLKAYLEWGEGCLKRLNGMFAFAIWDGRKGQCFIARDRFGVKPLYFHMAEGQLIFASEPKAILALTKNAQINRQTLYDLLAKGELYVSGQSFYDGIEFLPPAHAMIVNYDGRITNSSRYWDYPESEGEPTHSDSEAIDEFEELFDDAVCLRMRSDVPVGLTLSGGLDSSAILASFVKGDAGSPTCFTSSYDGKHYDEVSWAEKACKPYNLKPVPVSASQDDWVDTMRQVAWHMDGPGYSPAVFPLWNIMKRAKADNVPVLLEGQGADEAFGGYPQYFALNILQSLSGFRKSKQRKRLLKDWHDFADLGTRRSAILWMMRVTVPSLVYFQRKTVNAAQAFSPDFTKGLDTSFSSGAPVGMSRYGYGKVEERLVWDHSINTLPGLLQYGDSLSMAHSIEARQPFLDYRLVEWIFRQGVDVKIRDGQSKWIIRQYLRRNKQDAIADRMDKQGYPTPVDKWLATDNYNLFRSLASGSDSRLAQMTELRGLERLIEAHKRGRYNAGNHLYRLLSAELWLRSCF